MFQRPHKDETDEDLQKQEDAWKSQQFSPSAKVIHVNKRKTDEDKSQKGADGGEGPRSKFGRERNSKKKKGNIVDNTVLKEAVKKEETVAVLGRIVERVVCPEDSLREWHPEPSPHGFPKVPKLYSLGEASTTTSHTMPGIKKPSLYKQQLIKAGIVSEEKPSYSQDQGFKKSCGSRVSGSALYDPRVTALGKESVIISNQIIQDDDAKKIHSENIAKISSMSHEERLRHQKEILSSLAPEQIEFLKSLRKAKEKIQKKGAKEESQSQTPHSSSGGKQEYQGMECDSSENHGKDLMNKESLDDSVQGEGKDKKTVKFSEDVEMKEVPGDEIAELEKMGIPISLSEAKKWFQMSQVEVEKLKALTDMPAPKPLKDQEGFVARFDFEGNILPYDKDVSHLEALHHHGEEAGRPGYSLDEIFIFCRSKVLQQRHLGLRTLANILRNAKEGMYDICVNPPVIKLAIEAGVVLILRFALDETSELVYKEAVRGLYYLIASEPDEQCLSLSQAFVPSGLEPGVSSEIHANDEARQELDTEEQELKDIEIIKLDVIRALIRMDTQARLRYLLGVTKPGPETVIQIIGILTRIARHSLTAAWKLFQTPHLISTILENFLPHNLSPLLTGENVASMTSVYGVPLKHALHFLRVLAAKGRQLASSLLNTYDVMSQVLTYVSLEPSEMGMPQQEALMLSQESYTLWATFLAYGLNKPQEAFTSFYPMLVKQLIFYRDKVSINEDTEKNKFNYDVGACILSVMARAVNVAASHSLLKNKMILNQGTIIDTDGKSLVLPPPLLTWEDMNDLPSLVETCLNKWLVELMRSTETSFSALKLVGSCCYFLECYYSKWKDQTSYSGDVCNNRIVNIYNNILTPFLVSSAMQQLMGKLIMHSSLIADLLPGSRRDPVNLGSLGCVTHGGKIIPIVQKTSPFPLLLPFVSFCSCLHSLHPVLDPKPMGAMLESEELEQYLIRFCNSNHELRSHWLTRIEVHFIYYILQLGAMKGCCKYQLFHETALSLVPSIHKGDELLIKDLLGSVVCAPEFLADVTEISSRVDDIALKDYVPLKSPAQVQPVLSPKQLTDNICSSLKSMESELVSCLVSKKEYEASAVLKNGIPFITNGITISQTESNVALEKYWPLVPIKRVYNASKQKSKISESKEKPPTNNSSDQSAPEDMLTVTRCLQMTYLCLKYRRKCFFSETNSFAWLQHLSLVFLVASDMFLDANVSSYLQGCIVELLRNKGYVNLEAVNHIKGFNSCIAWYKEMLEHFQGVSYGDSTFALFLLIPLQQYWDVEFRLQFWGDMSDALPFVFLSPEEVTQFIPMKQFCEPDEEDERLIIKYRGNLGSRVINEKRNSFLYKIAVHHVRQYMEKQKS
ncbi:RNA polymerase II-associated protein 1 isoform X1 [Macrobrachium rosenbergii]|uniref:RNA polymerase II-associated protein 1 isoform X1 n=1 Tax=Macrobrachium rosenbergii TaxID=79674 RepID=UPI0034D60A6B